MNVSRSFFLNIFFFFFLPFFPSSSFPPPAPTHPSFLSPPLPSPLSAHLMHLFFSFSKHLKFSLGNFGVFIFFLFDLENHVVAFVSLCINSLIFFDWFFRNNSRSVSKSCLDNISVFFFFVFFLGVPYSMPILGQHLGLLGCLSRNQLNAP